MNRRWPRVLAYLSVILAGVIAYARSLQVPFVFDDELAVVNNPSIRRLSDLRAVFWAPPEAAGATGRPLVNASLALNYAIGGLSPIGYHVFNLLLHLASALLLLALVRRTLERIWGAENGGRSLLAAWACAFVWVVHPLGTESVICIVQRDEVMASLLILASLYAFVRGWLALAFAASVLAAASKEIAVVILPALLAYDRCFVSGSFTRALRNRRGFYASLLLSWVLVAAFLLGTRHRGDSVGFGLGISSWDYLLTQARAIGLYLRLAVWPQPLVVDYGSPVVRSLSTVLLPGVGILALLASAAALFASDRPWRRAVGWTMLLAFGILAPSSSVVPLVTQTIAEHRMYLPLACLLAVAFGAAAGAARSRTARIALGVIVAALGASSVAGTLRRSDDYADPLRLWQVTAAQVPSNPRVLLNLGTLYSRNGRLQEAVASYQESIGADPNAADTHYDLAAVLEATGQVPRAESEYAEATRLGPDMPNVRLAYGLLLSKEGRFPEAIAQLSEAQRLQPDSSKARNGRSAAEELYANRLCASGRIPEALPHFEEAVELKPDFAQALNNWGNALAYLGRHDEALDRLGKAVAADPAYADAQYNFALELAEAGRLSEALAHMKAAAGLRPGDPQIAGDLRRLQAQSQ